MNVAANEKKKTDKKSRARLSDATLKLCHQNTRARKATQHLRKLVRMVRNLRHCSKLRTATVAHADEALRALLTFGGQTARDAAKFAPLLNAAVGDASISEADLFSRQRVNEANRAGSYNAGNRETQRIARQLRKVPKFAVNYSGGPSK